MDATEQDEMLLLEILELNESASSSVSTLDSVSSTLKT
jgi:hypothetical protein